jgi:hypothetical protein
MLMQRTRYKFLARPRSLPCDRLPSGDRCLDRRIEDYLQKYPDEDRGTLVADLAVAAAEARRTVEALAAAPESQWHDEGAAIESLTDVLLKAAEQSKPMWRRMVENYFTNTHTAPIPERVARARAHFIAAERLLLSRIEVAD